MLLLLTDTTMQYRVVLYLLHPFTVHGHPAMVDDNPPPYSTVQPPSSQIKSDPVSTASTGKDDSAQKANTAHDHLVTINDIPPPYEAVHVQPSLSDEAQNNNNPANEASTNGTANVMENYEDETSEVNYS